MKKLFLQVTFLLLLLPIVVTATGKQEPTGEENVLKFSFYYGAQPVDDPFAGGDATRLMQEEWLKRMENYLGMKVDIQWDVAPEMASDERIRLYVAARDFHDVFSITGPENTLSLGQAGLVVNLFDYNQYLPNYSKWLDDNLNREALTTEDGKLYSFSPGVLAFGDITQNFYIYRLDIFEKHNIKIPESLDEIYNAAKQLKRLYPESYPIAAWPGMAWGMETAFGYTNKTASGVYFNGKRFVLGMIEDQEVWKEILMYMNKLYSEKLIRPEYLTITPDQLYQDGLTGVSFIMPSFWGALVTEVFNSNEEFPVRWCVAMRPKGFDGTIGWRHPGANEPEGKTLLPFWTVMISVKAENPAMLVKLLDYEYSDEIVELKNWGIEGQHFVRDANGERKFTVTDKEGLAALYPASYFGLILNQDRSWLNARFEITHPTPIYFDGKVTEMGYWKFSAIEADRMGGNPPDMPQQSIVTTKLTKEENAIVANVMTAIQTYIDESMPKFVNGQTGFDNWDEFVADIKKFGDYKEVLDIYNSKLADLQ